MEQPTELAATSIEAPPSGEWKLDQAHSSLSFVARYLMLTKVRGRFTGFDGTLHIGTTPEDSWAEVALDAASIDTDNETRDEHLRSPDFLAVAEFPTLAFRSTRIERTGETTLRVTGDLTIRGVTRAVVLETEYEGITKGIRGDTRVAFSATTELDRDDWGVSWNMALETGGVLVGKRVQVELEVQAILQQEEKDPAAG